MHTLLTHPPFEIPHCTIPPARIAYSQQPLVARSKRHAIPIHPDIPLYHSKPGASSTIFIDVDGHVIENTAWNTDGAPAVLYAWPLDSDGNLNSFSASEQAVITGIWQRMAEDFAPFDVDITTEEPQTFDSRTGRCLITRDSDLNTTAMPGRGASHLCHARRKMFASPHPLFLF
jgi:hypothetical protein